MARPVDNLFWTEQKEKLFTILEPDIEELMEAGAIAGLNSVGLDIGSNWHLINQEVLDWTYANTQRVVNKITQTSMHGYMSEFEDWVNSGKPMSDLEDSLLKYYSPERAKWVAVTETTRSYAAGNIAAWKQGGMVEAMRWNTAEDDIVCPICSPLAGKIVSIQKGFSHPDLDRTIDHPPAHVMCRCWLQPVLVLPDNIGQEVAGYDPFDWDAALGEMEGMDHLEDVFQGRAFRDRKDWEASVSDYKGSLYSDINGSLRSGKTPAWMGDGSQMSKYIADIDKAMDSAPLLEHDIIAHRGMRKSTLERVADFETGSPNSLVGKTIEDLGYGSSSLNPEIGKRFAGDYGVSIQFKIPKGTKGIWMGDPEWEAEFLLPRGCSWIIKSVKYDSSISKFVAEAVLQVP